MHATPSSQKQPGKLAVSPNRKNAQPQSVAGSVHCRFYTDPRLAYQGEMEVCGAELSDVWRELEKKP